MATPTERLRHHVTGAVKRGEAEPIVEIERDLTQAEAVTVVAELLNGNRYDDATHAEIEVDRRGESLIAFTLPSGQPAVVRVELWPYR